MWAKKIETHENELGHILILTASSLQFQRCATYRRTFCQETKRTSVPRVEEDSEKLQAEARGTEGLAFAHVRKKSQKIQGKQP